MHTEHTETCPFSNYFGYHEERSANSNHSNLEKFHLLCSCKCIHIFVGGYCGEVEEAKPVAIVARYNATLFAQLVHICDTRPDAKLGFPGGLKKSRLLILEDIYKLENGPREDIVDKTIKHYETYGGLKKFAFKTEDIELCTRIKVCSLFSQMNFTTLLL